MVLLNLAVQNAMPEPQNAGDSNPFAPSANIGHWGSFDTISEGLQYFLLHSGTDGETLMAQLLDSVEQAAGSVSDFVASLAEEPGAIVDHQLADYLPPHILQAGLQLLGLDSFFAQWQQQLAEHIRATHGLAALTPQTVPACVPHANVTNATQVRAG